MAATYSIPAEMTAMAVQDKKLIAEKRPVPALKSGEVLVRVNAAGVNRADVLQRQGIYPPPPGASDIPGLEISGEVVLLGKGAKGLKLGQKVCAIVTGGGYAEYCAVPAGQALPLPGKIGMIASAGIPEAFFTVWENIFVHGRLKSGNRLLVHGGSSGVGTTAIQMARAFGAEVYITAGSDEKCKACRRLGANLSINYKRHDFAAQVMTATKGFGVDVILDMVGGDYLPRNLKILADGGRHVSIATQNGRRVEVDLAIVMAKRLILTGSMMRTLPVIEKTRIAKALKKNVWPLVVRKRITPVIDKTFPLSDAQAAHDYLESGAHIGKVVLKI